LIQIYNAYFEYANFFKDIFKIFSKVLITNNKKQQLTAVLCKLPDRSMPTLRSLTQSRKTLCPMPRDTYEHCQSDKKRQKSQHFCTTFNFTQTHPSPPTTPRNILFNL
jgi:hypothetical protein